MNKLSITVVILASLLSIQDSNASIWGSITKAVSDAGNAVGTVLTAPATIIPAVIDTAAKVVDKSAEVAGDTIAAGANATGDAVVDAAKKTAKIAESTVKSLAQAGSAAGNLVEAGVQTLQGDSDSANNALKRSQKNIKNSAKNGDVAIDGAVNLGLSSARYPIIFGVKSADAGLHTDGTLFRETERSSKKIGAALRVASEPKNVGKIALIYGATVLGGPLGSAFANVMYDKLILKKSMSDREMLNSFAIGAAAGYAAQGMQGALEGGGGGADTIHYTSYLSKSTSAVTRNLSTDAGNIILNNSGYSSKDFFKSLATGASAVHFGDDFTAHVIESTVESGLDSASIQAIDSHLKKVDLTKVSDSMLSGFANGITREAVQAMLDATVLAGMSPEDKLANKKNVDDFSEMFYQTLVAVQQSNNLIAQEAIMDRFAELDQETQREIYESLSTWNRTAQSYAAQHVFKKQVSQLSKDELKSEEFFNAYAEKINSAEKIILQKHPEFAELMKPILTDRDPAGAAEVLSDIANTAKKTGLTLVEGGAVAELAANAPKILQPLPIVSVFIAFFISRSADGEGSDMTISGQFTVPLPLDPTDQKGMDLYNRSKNGDHGAYLEYLNYESEQRKTGMSGYGDGKKVSDGTQITGKSNTTSLSESNQYGATPEGRPLTKHYATETGPERNIPGSVVDNTINTTVGVPVEGGKIVYYDPVNDITVVTGNGQSIVSVHKGSPRKGQY